VRNDRLNGGMLRGEWRQGLFGEGDVGGRQRRFGEGDVGEGRGRLVWEA